jgi:quercetin dioxygenase-like cupin family protein
MIASRAVPSLLVLALLALPSAAAAPPRETVKPILQQELPNAPGKTFSSVLVELAPGARSVPHRHGQAFVFAYVLRGEIKNQVDDGPLKTFKAGESWHELPGAHHAAMENASATEPAALLAILVSNTGDPLTTEDASK